MKKFFIPAALLTLSLSFGFVSCGDDNDNNTTQTPGGKTDGDEGNKTQSDADLDITTENSAAWCNYMKNVAVLLNTDSKNLSEAWSVGYKETGKTYAELFKTHDNASGYTDVDACLQEMIEKMGEIANEVGSSKIGDPYAKWTGGKQTEALYAVESWYSWHSRDDYTNNIMSIKNAYYGTLGNTYNKEATAAEYSLANYLKGSDIDTKMRAAIDEAANAIQNIAQPFRNNIGSTQTVAAMDACEKLQRLIGEISTDDGDKAGEATNLKDYAKANLTEAQKQNIINHFVDVIVVPTYKDLATKNTALLAAVNTLVANPTDANFEAACDAWMQARQPWETSEAFLFGPVDEFGLDPNMDSWPLDQTAIVNILKSNSWASLEWADGDTDAKVESAQNVRGFHTLEYLLFKDGQPRKAAK